MRLPMPFDPIEVGEVDNFAFDFTADVGVDDHRYKLDLHNGAIPDGN